MSAFHSDWRSLRGRERISDVRERRRRCFSRVRVGGGLLLLPLPLEEREEEEEEEETSAVRACSCLGGIRRAPRGWCSRMVE